MTRRPTLHSSQAYNLTTLRFLLALAAQIDLQVHVLDVNTAFQDGSLDECSYVHIYLGLQTAESRHLVCLLI